MWKKFFVALLSIAVLSTAGVLSTQLHAESDNSVVVREANEQTMYIHDDLEFEVTTSRMDEKILFIQGGTITGNTETITIPLQDDTSSFVVKGIETPGAYQGNIQVQSAKLDGSNAQSKEVSFSFVVYGKAFENKIYQVKQQEEKQALIFGVLPQALQTATIKYEIEDERIATIDDAGVIKGINVGETKAWVRVYDKETLLSSDSCQIQVLEQAQEEEKTILEGSEHGYRFVALKEEAIAQTTNQAIGSIQLGQSGEHTYEFDGEENNLEIKDGIVSIKNALKEGDYEASLMITNSQSKTTYQIPITYRVRENTETKETSFEFRYDGSATTNIIRDYQPGNNTFQLSSNQNVSEVTFRLKEESDTEFLTISKTGNVTVKKATTKPVLIEASYQKQTYELPLLIEKANQNITISKEQLTLQLEDGAFEPLIQGVKGNGSFVVSMEDESILQVEQKEQGNLMFMPKQVGETKVTLYHAGDENFKESNRIELHVSIQSQLEQTNDKFIGDLAWLTLPQANEQGWVHEPFTIALQKDSPATSMIYQDQVVKEIPCMENGEFTYPVIFQDENQQASDPISLNVKLDTHAPMITNITIDDVVDSPWKELLNSATFQQAYGTGQEVVIEASDALVNLQQKTSGVKAIAYQVYVVQAETEILTQEAQMEFDESLSFYVDSEDIIKVCASAIDNADLQSDEVCQLSKGSSSIPTIQSKNSGIMLRSMAFEGNEQFEVVDVLADLSKEEQQGIGGAIASAFALSSTDIEKIDLSEAPMQLIIPMTYQEVSQKGVWKQKQSDGGYVDIPSSYQGDSCILSVTSLQPVVLVEETDSPNHQIATSSLRLSSKESSSNPVQTQVTPLLANRDWQIIDGDVQALTIALGALVIGLFLIIALRSHHMEDVDDPTDFE